MYRKDGKKSRKRQAVKHVLVLIRRIINFSASLHLCPRFDFNIDMPKFDNKVTEDLTEEQRKRLQSVK